MSMTMRAPRGTPASAIAVGTTAINAINESEHDLANGQRERQCSDPHETALFVFVVGGVDRFDQMLRTRRCAPQRNQQADRGW